MDLLTLTVPARESAGEPYTLVTISGEADVTNREDLRGVLDTEVAQEPRMVILDLSGLRFMDSSALHVILQANRSLDRKGGMMALVAPQDAVAKMLRLTTADRLIPVFRTIAEAAAGLPVRDFGFRAAATGIITFLVVPTTQARCSRHGVIAERAVEASLSVSLAAFSGDTP